MTRPSPTWPSQQPDSNNDVAARDPGGFATLENSGCRGPNDLSIRRHGNRYHVASQMVLVKCVGAVGPMPG